MNFMGRRGECGGSHLIASVFSMKCEGRTDWLSEEDFSYFTLLDSCG